VIDQYNSASGTFSFYQGTIGVGPSSTVFANTYNGVGFDLQLASGNSAMNVGNFASGYSLSNFTNHSLGSGPQTSWNVGL